MVENERKQIENSIRLSDGKVGESVDFSDVSMVVNDGSQIFKAGDEFSIDKDWKKNKFQQYFGAEARKTEHQARPAKGVLVECKDGSIKQLFISTFKKSVMPYDKDTTQRLKNADGTAAANVTAGGTAVAAFLACEDADKGFDALAGKKCKISKCHEVTTMRLRANGSRTLGTSYVYDIDLA